jgi:hypothetical protein
MKKSATAIQKLGYLPNQLEISSSVKEKIDKELYVLDLDCFTMVKQRLKLLLLNYQV